jgi:hypothetical protein
VYGLGFKPTSAKDAISMRMQLPRQFSVKQGIYMNLRAMTTCAVLSLSVVTTTVAWAQQRDVMKACSADAKSLCAGITPGEGRIAKCFKENENRVSPACKEKLQAAGNARGKGNHGGRNADAPYEAAKN